MSEPEALVDTNILGYIFDADAADKRVISRNLLARCWKGEVRYAVSVQNLAEFAVVVTEKVESPLPFPVVRTFIDSIVTFEGWTKIGYQGSTITDAIAIKERYNLHFWDALLVATMQEHGISRIYTEDQGFRKVPGCIPVNPFA
jgi:predicted nucleic acid-binding protein